MSERQMYGIGLIDTIQKQIKSFNYRYTIHGFERCVERGISPNEIENVILSGEIIENYTDDKYGPTCLIHGKTEKGKVLHVHCSIDPVWIITAYDPTLNPEEWEVDYKRRRKKL